MHGEGLPFATSCGSEGRSEGETDYMYRIITTYCTQALKSGIMWAIVYQLLDLCMCAIANLLCYTHARVMHPHADDKCNMQMLPQGNARLAMVPSINYA